MALIRITPENAVDTVLEQLDLFAESVANAGRAPSMLKLGEDAVELKELAASGCLEVEVIGLGGLHPSWTGVIAKWVGIDPEPLAKVDEEKTTIELEADLSKVASVVRVRSQLDTPPERAGTRVPPILVVGCGTPDAPDKESLGKVLQQIQSRPLTLVLAPKDLTWARALTGLGSRNDFVCKSRNLEELSAGEGTLADSLDQPTWKQACELAASWSIAGGLASLYEAFSVALEKEDRAARAKKAAVEQRAQQLQSAPMPTELLGDARAVIQKPFDRFQKDVSRQLKDLVAQHEGSLWREIDAAAGELDHFDVVKKPKSDVVSVPADFLNPLLDRIKEVLGEACRSSQVRLRDLLRDVKQDMEQLLEERGGPPVVLHFQKLPPDQVDKILERAVTIQRPYKGDITRKGVMDIFMAARRYQMLFFMIFSAFGLSFIRSFTAFTVPAGLMLMAYGFLNVYQGFKQQRAEAEEKELGKARDSLRSELTRAMGEVQKLWDQTLSAFMTEQQQNALELVEGTIRTSSAMDSRHAAGDKELVQQQIKSLDASQKKLAEGIKNADAASTDLTQIRSSLIEFFVSATAPPEAAAGAPGAGAAAGAAAAGAPSAADLKAQAEAKLAKLGSAAGGGGKKPPSKLGSKRDAAGGASKLSAKLGSKLTAKKSSSTATSASADRKKAKPAPGTAGKKPASQLTAKKGSAAAGAAAAGGGETAKPTSDAGGRKLSAKLGAKKGSSTAKLAAKATPDAAKLKQDAQARLQALKDKAAARSKKAARKVERPTKKEDGA